MGYSVKTDFWSLTGKPKLYDENGKEVSITYEQAKAALAQEKALNDIKNSIEKTSNLLEESVQILNNFGLDRNNAIGFLSSIANGKINLGNFT